MRLNSLHQKARLTAASAIDQLRNILAKSAEGTATHQLDLSELEDRILLSASPAAVMVESAPAAESAEVASPLAEESASLFAPPQTTSAESSDSTSGNSSDQIGQTSGDILSQPTSLDELNEFASSILSESPAEQTSTEVIFIDEAAEDFEQLVADLESQRDAGRVIDFFVLDSQQDGIDQVAETLERYSDLDAVHIVSHGTTGAVKLGATWLRIGSLDGYAGTIAGWGNAIGTDGDILIYGCDLASDSRGEALVDSISALTGADVAASTDDTGHAFFGGDWDLEYQTGTIEAQIAVTEELQSSWGHLLNVTIDATSTGTTPSFAASDTVSHTTSGTDRLMLVGISFGQDKGDTVSSVTYNGTNLTLVGTQDNGVALGSRMEIWSLVAPDVGTSDVVVNFSGTNHIGATIGVMTFNGVDQATALGSFASSEGDSSTPSTTVSSASGELVFGVLAVDHNADIDLVPGAGQTEQWDLFRDKATGGGTTEAGAASVDTSWTLPLARKWAAGGVSIKPAASNGPLASKDEFLVNTTTGNTQVTSNEDRGSSRAVAVAPNGEYVVVWSSNDNTGGDTDGYSVRMQRFDSAGNPIGSELQVNGNTTSDQLDATVAIDDSGRGVVVWTDTHSGDGVNARLFHSDGTLSGGEFLVNTTTSGAQDNSAVGMDSVGNFVVVWEGNGPGDSSGIFGQRFDAAGGKVGSEFRVNNTTSGTQSEPSVAMNASGQFAVVWDDGNGVHARTYESNGSGGSGAQFNVDNGSSAGQSDVGIDDSGKTVVTWRETDGTFGKGVYRRVFAFDGTVQTGDDVVNSQVAFDQTDPSISIVGDGSYIIAWEGAGFTDSDGVAYQKYDSGDSKVGSETAINQTMTGLQSQVSLAMLDLNNFVVVWSGNGEQSGEVDVDGVFARQYGSLGNLAPSADAGGLYVINEGDSLNLVASASSDPDSDPLTYRWDLDNDGNYGEAGEPTTETPTVSWATLRSFGIDDDGVYTIGLQVDDGNGGINTTTTTVTVNNTAPVLSTTGSGTVSVGSSYTLNLTASDPGADTITSWTINWGDGTIETIAGNPSVTNHTYSNAGFTHNIIVSASDADGTYAAGGIIASSLQTDSVFRYRASDGSFLQEFGQGDANNPVDVQIGPDGGIYVTGFGSNNVYRYDPDGTGGPNSSPVTAVVCRGHHAWPSERTEISMLPV